MFSIDQNCHSLWDALPKLQALDAAGHGVTHFVEDVDVAFTALGSSIDDSVLHLTRERFHRSGGQDWGAALFYAEFLGKLPVEIRHWEPATGLKTRTLAKQLGRSVDDLYDEFSPGDTWQLIGSSYIGDRNHHRVIGDLSVRETRCFLLELFHRARDDMFRAFPSAESRQRLAEWFCAEEGLMAQLLEEHADAGLVDLYAHWLRRHLGTTRVQVGVSSDLFALGADPTRTALLEAFLTDYDRCAAAYNTAIAETDADVRPLAVADGELPFFAVQDHQGHRVRTASALRDGWVHFGQQPFRVADGRLPLEAMASAGIHALAAKALLLVTQARIGPSGRRLALPYRGSLYMPTAHRLARKLSDAGLLPGSLQPVVRVRFHLLDRMRALDTPVRLPAHLAPYFGREETSARDIGENYESIASEAALRLEQFRDDAGRQALQATLFPDLTEQIAALEERRITMARGDCTPEQMSAIWNESKALQLRLLDETVRQIARDTQAADIDYWDSRGALLPWAVALGGTDFYNNLVANAEIYEETE
ncbi:hypothetical protein HQ560_15425 [bacterium]|nr:hypothetical protein [bacterium]